MNKNDLAPDAVSLSKDTLVPGFDDTAVSHRRRPCASIDDSALLVDVIAAAVVQELACPRHRVFANECEAAECSSFLAKKARRLYACNSRFRRQCDRSIGRDYLYAFMRHWLAGWVLEKFGRPALALLPDGFANGKEAR